MNYRDDQNLNMKIITINVPKRYLKYIEHQLKVLGHYPSRSEYIRCAIREFIIKEMTLAEKMEQAKTVEAIETWYETAKKKYVNPAEVVVGDTTYSIVHREGR